MTKEELYNKFVEMFPVWARYVVKYKKIGSKCLAIYYSDDESYVFLYIDRHNWQFGTKLWRRRPEQIKEGGENNA